MAIITKKEFQSAAEGGIILLELGLSGHERRSPQRSRSWSGWSSSSTNSKRSYRLSRGRMGLGGSRHMQKQQQQQHASRGQPQQHPIYWSRCWIVLALLIGLIALGQFELHRAKKSGNKSQNGNRTSLRRIYPSKNNDVTLASRQSATRHDMYYMTIQDTFDPTRTYEILRPGVLSTTEEIPSSLVAATPEQHQQQQQQQQLRPCRIAVINSEATHFETLESIAASLPSQFFRAVLHNINSNNHGRSMKDRSCDDTQWIFDYHLYVTDETDATHPISAQAQAWIAYYNHALRNVTWSIQRNRHEYDPTDIVDTSNNNNNDNDMVTERRSMGSLVTYRQRHTDTGGQIMTQIEPPQSLEMSDTATPPEYDIMLQASCYCRRMQPALYYPATWLGQSPSQPAGATPSSSSPYANRMCIFHERCPWMQNDVRGIWLSPHHVRYHIPIDVPRFAITTNMTAANPSVSLNTGEVSAPGSDGLRMLPPVSEMHIPWVRPAPYRLCVTGDTQRRNWELLRVYLQTPHAQEWTHDAYNDVEGNGRRLQILILGGGEFPVELEHYRHVVQQIQIPDYVGFHHQVAHQCHALLLLATKDANPSYFRSDPNSQQPYIYKQKLSRTMVLAMAYRLPAVLHEELYDLYRHRLPRPNLYDIPYEMTTHSDSPSSFADAVTVLLERLRHPAPSAHLMIYHHNHQHDPM